MVTNNKILQNLPHPVVVEMLVVRGPIQFDGKGAAKSSAPALLGEHRSDALAEMLGYSDAQIQELTSKGCIRNT
tara:strand:+ start:704 stop:925 length:222 start_codon:yes stop_codon:yes gene_type:complete